MYVICYFRSLQQFLIKQFWRREAYLNSQHYQKSTLQSEKAVCEFWITRTTGPKLIYMYTYLFSFSIIGTCMNQLFLFKLRCLFYQRIAISRIESCCILGKILCLIFRRAAILGHSHRIIGRTRIPYTATYNGAVSYGAKIGSIRVLAEQRA